ncbi:unnamed protein product [Pleuronectes platessa]|uniref:Uncharacterized protein n=1 Tax=Pleuronectes platessa TaxID=8262 RepID=A0A9N7U091_PLEPL|nr:unnamed protein product [Pleuronectes platessa]
MSPFCLSTRRCALHVDACRKRDDDYKVDPTFLEPHIIIIIPTTTSIIILLIIIPFRDRTAPPINGPRCPRGAIALKWQGLSRETRSFTLLLFITLISHQYMSRN